MVPKYIVHVHITAEQKASWLLVIFELYHHLSKLAIGDKYVSI